MAAEIQLVHIDLNQNEIQNVVLQNLVPDPSSPLTGQIWYRTTSNRPVVYDGTTDQELAYLSDITTEALAVDLDENLAGVTRTFAGGETLYRVDHSLSSKDLLLQCKEISSDSYVSVLIQTPTNSRIEVTFNGDSPNGDFRVLTQK